jgi:hypothetical protein
MKDTQDPWYAERSKAMGSCDGVNVQSQVIKPRQKSFSLLYDRKNNRLSITSAPLNSRIEVVSAAGKQIAGFQSPGPHASKTISNLAQVRQ